MSTIKDLIISLEKLLKLHKSLYDIALKKTDYIKVGDMDALNKVINEEQSYVYAIQQLESKRQEMVHQLLPNKKDPKVIDCYEVAEGEESSKLTDVTNKINEILPKIKEQNYANQQLIHQSLQFVNFSLSLLVPQPELMNYGPPSEKKKINRTDTLFNSKA